MKRILVCLLILAVSFTVFAQGAKEAAKDEPQKIQ